MLKKFILLLALITSLVMLAGCAASGAASAQGTGEEESWKKTENMDLETIYRFGLGSYLREKLDLDAYEKQVDGFGCLAVEPLEKREEQIRDRTGTRYIYVRNNIHTERLSSEDVEILKNGKLYPDGSLSEEAMEVVIRTFPVVISAADEETGKNKELTTMYDNSIIGDMESYQVPADCLLLQIATQSERDKEGREVSHEKESEKEKLLYDLAQKMEKNMNGLLGGVPVRVRVDFVL